MNLDTIQKSECYLSRKLREHLIRSKCDPLLLDFHLNIRILYCKNENSIAFEETSSQSDGP